MNMALDNFVKLEPDREKILRIKEGSFRIEPRIIKDPSSKQTKTVNSAVMDVIQEDGRTVQKGFSTLSDKLAVQLKAAHDNGTLYRYSVGIKRVGSGFVTEYQLRLI
jgi:hypothetical protein